MAREKVKWCETCAMLANSEEGNRWLEAQIRDLEAKLAKVVAILDRLRGHDPVLHIEILSRIDAALAAAKGE